MVLPATVSVVAMLCASPAFADPSVGSANPTGRAGQSPAEPDSSSHDPSGDPSGNPYGNPFNDFLRTPYGVMSSPEQQQTLPPVQDDPDEAFDYYRYPRAAIGVYGGPEESIVTAEGYLKTVFGTLEFATGSNDTPVDQRVKTWRDGYLPMLEYSFDRSGVRNQIEMFAARVPGVTTVPYTERYGVPSQTFTAQVQNMINFVKVTFTNTTPSPVTYAFSASLGTGHITEPNGNLAGRTWNPGPSRPSTITYDPETRSFGGDGKLVYTVSADPDTIGSDPSSPRATWSLDLPPGASRSLVFKMPYFVAPSSDATAIAGADYADTASATAAFWHQTLDDAGTSIDLPGSGVERKVTDTYKASLALSLIDVDLIGDRCFWDANPTVYDNYYLRDAAFDLDGMLNAGFRDLVRTCTLEMLPWQNADGEFQSQSNEWDGNGEALWMFGDYYRRTHDVAFAKQVYPAVERAMAWEWQLRQDAWPQSHGLFPALSMRDNEHVTGHVLTYDLWAIAGERGAAAIAAAAGHPQTAAAWTDRSDQYVQILRKALQPAVSDLGWIPPTTEGMEAVGTGTGWYGSAYGIDWGNLEAVWPSGVFAPDDPWITESLQAWDQKMFEGVFTYPSGGREGVLHSYTPISISVTDVRAGDQMAAVQSLYDLLVHTSATDTTTEGINAAQRWGWNDSNRTQPHGEFAGKYLTLLHDMLAFSGQDGDLHLANAWSPVWAQPGRHLAFSGDTDFGHVGYAIDVRDDGMTMHLSPPDRDTPTNIVISAPPGTTITAVNVTGDQQVRFTDRTITLPTPSTDVTITVRWNRTAVQPLSFSRAVQDYERNYRKLTSAPDVQLSGLRTSRPTVRAGQPLVVSATVTNTGGAGYLADPDVTFYVDGAVAQTDSSTFAKGIGFSTPGEVISFARNTEGVVPVEFTTRLCAVGKHTVSIGLGDGQPLASRHVQIRPRPASAPAPDATVTLSAQPQYVDDGGNGTLTATVTNTGCEAITGARLTLHAPAGWDLTADGSTQLGTIEPGESARMTWSYDAAVGQAGRAVTPAQFSAAVTYGWRGITTGSAGDETTLHVLQPVQAPYLTRTDTTAFFGQSGDTFAIAAGGRDMGGTYDEFGAIYTKGTATPSTVATTTVTGQGDTWPWAKAGLMMRADIGAAHSPGYAVLGVTPSNGVQFLWDSDGNGTLNKNVNKGVTQYPVQLKLVRSGSTFTGYYSYDGSTWTEVGSGTVENPEPVEDVGMFATAVNIHVPGAVSLATFDGLHVSHPSVAALADAYNNIGITDDGDTTPGNFDGGNSFSATALADAGVTPGQQIVHDGLTFTWPDVPAGQPDNVAGSAAVRLTGSGDTLGFLGAAVHDQTGSGIVVYTDGTVQTYTVDFPNYYAGRDGSNPPGPDVIADCDYRNTSAGPANSAYQYRVYYRSVPLDPDKTVSRVTLPGNPDMHVFAAAIG